MTKITLSNISKIMISKIERHPIGDRVEENRAIEVMTDKGRVLIILEGMDLQFYNSGE